MCKVLESLLPLHLASLGTLRWRRQQVQAIHIAANNNLSLHSTNVPGALHKRLKFLWNPQSL